jgi:hypothetical protein
MADPKVVKAQQTLQSIHGMVMRAADTYQKARDKAGIEKFFPDLDTATAQMTEVLRAWPDFDSLSEADQKVHGSFLSHLCEDLLKKITSKV